MPKKAINYQRTIIYKIVCEDLSITDNYVGHTTNFVKRKTQHRNNCNNENSKSYNFKIYQTIRNNGGWENWKMIEVQKYPCNDVNEAKARERYWLEKLNAKMNTTIPNRTDREYKIDNRAVILEKQKIYREKNRDVILEKNKVYKQKNKNIINQKHLCECGKEYTHSNKSRHLKTQYHINFVETTEKTLEEITEEI